MIELYKLTDGGIIAKLDADEVAKLAKVTEPPVNNYLALPVPHISQRGATADKRSRDCMAACVVMVLAMFRINKTVDSIAGQFQNPPNTNMNFADGMAALSWYGVKRGYKRPFMADAIIAAIKDNHPVIALVKYPHLPYKAVDFGGYHFIVCYGVTDEGAILYHDPLFKSDTKTEISIDALDVAMSNYPTSDNRHYQALVCG